MATAQENRTHANTESDSLESLGGVEPLQQDEQPHAGAHINPYEHMKFQLNPDNTITRLSELPTLAASVDDPLGDTRGILSKDVTFNKEKKTWARILRPKPSDLEPGERLPLVIYFHGGGFTTFTAGTVFCNNLCERAARLVPCIFVSVSYRLAPEHRLPAAYEDADDALMWLKEQALDTENGEPWLRELADFSRILLCGWNSGANVAFHARLRALDLDLGPLKILGVMMTQPLFGGMERTQSDYKYADDQMLPLTVNDLIWELALPVGANRDHEYCNPWGSPGIIQKLRNMGKVLVRGYGGDITIDRQRALVELLVKNGVQVVAHFDDIGFHGIDLIDSRRAVATLNYLKDFINSTSSKPKPNRPLTHCHSHSRSHSQSHSSPVPYPSK
ncbi:probable carboxylesterase 9 [Macadamia integrifolia]|uniref:probable carboxylesterase 9 n=1 Tax=Macadamia integrifolia TaxID=60698 RepID=UPI001C4F28DA|nr:probable carboxylesterase 9 [Macadamia integrifolia]